MWGRQQTGSSPHTRGALAPGTSETRQKRIIPAYAGSTAFANEAPERNPDHPRIRGEHAVRRHPPRGAKRIIPAYAGSTCEGRLGWGVPWDHPRIRGEHYSHECELPDSHGSSPHTRGAPTRQVKSAYDDRIIPAYAGSTL